MKSKFNSFGTNLHFKDSKKNSANAIEKKLEKNISFNEIRHRAGIPILIVLLLLFFALIIIFANISNKTASQLNKCNTILIKSYKNSCLMSLAISTKNISICNLTNNKNACFKTIASLNNNSNYCNLINNTSEENNCILNISIRTRNETLCTNLSDPYKSSCTYYFAQLNNFTNLSLLNECNSIANSSDRAVCTNLFYYNKMIKTRNDTYCQYLSNKTNLTIMSYILNISNANITSNINKSYIISKNITNVQNLSKLNTNITSLLQPKIVDQESELIEFISNNISPENLCYYNFALNFNNKSACRFSGNLSFQCSSTFENLTNNSIYNKTFNFTSAINKCNKLPISNLSALCEIGISTQYAIKEKNASYCTKTGNQNIENICISNLATDLNDSSYCNYLQNKTLEFDCLAQFNVSMINK